MGLISALISATTQSFDLVKARSPSAENQNELFSRGPGKAAVSDPHIWLLAGGNYVEKPNSLSYNVLRYLARRDPVVAAIVLTRLRQVKAFATPRLEDQPQKTLSTGFRVKAKGKKSGKATKAREEELTDFFAKCARGDVEKKDRREKNFGNFLQRFVKDRLQIDQAVAELQLDRKGNAVQFYAVDGASIRLVDKNAKNYSGYKYVQVYQGQVIAKFTDEEMAFCPENVSSDLESCGYGMSEIEYALRSVMAHLGEINAPLSGD